MNLPIQSKEVLLTNKSKWDLILEIKLKSRKFQNSHSQRSLGNNSFQRIGSFDKIMHSEGKLSRVKIRWWISSIYPVLKLTKQFLSNSSLKRVIFFNIACDQINRSIKESNWDLKLMMVFRFCLKGLYSLVFKNLRGPLFSTVYFESNKEIPWNSTVYR